MDKTALIDIYTDPAFSEQVELNIGRDPLAIAADRTVPFASVVATQVKYLQRAKSKLPSFYAARCILPPRAFEQSSSEAAAFSKDFSGGTCIDLTCGLGVDAFALSHSFEKVIAVERDPELAAIVRHNLGLLGAGNIEVVNMASEEFIRRLQGTSVGVATKVDIVYADPDRRSCDGRKLVTLDDCSPDIPALMPILKTVSNKIVLKLSPLFSVDEAIRLFGPGLRVSAVSLAGECKEILAEIDGSIEKPMVSAVMLRPSAGAQNAADHDFARTVAEFEYKGKAASDASINMPAPPPSTTIPVAGKFLLVPDVSLRVIGCVSEYFRREGIQSDPLQAYGIVESPRGEYAGRLYEILWSGPVDYKILRKWLAGNNITRINLLKSPATPEKQSLLKKLSVREGGDHYAAFSKVDGKRSAFILKSFT